MVVALRRLPALKGLFPMGTRPDMFSYLLSRKHAAALATVSRQSFMSLIVPLKLEKPLHDLHISKGFLKFLNASCDITPPYSFILQVSTLSHFQFKYIPHALDVLLLYVCGASGTQPLPSAKLRTSSPSIINTFCASNSACPLSHFRLQVLFEAHTREVAKGSFFLILYFLQNIKERPL